MSKPVATSYSQSNNYEETRQALNPPPNDYNQRFITHIIVTEDASSYYRSAVYSTLFNAILVP